MVEIIEVDGWSELDTRFNVELKSLEALENMADAYSEPYILTYRKDYLLIVRGKTNIFYRYHEQRTPKVRHADS